MPAIFGGGGGRPYFCAQYPASSTAASAQPEAKLKRKHNEYEPSKVALTMAIASSPRTRYVEAENTAENN